MEVSGRRSVERDTNHASSETPTVSCFPCLQDGNTQEAEGYCVDCEHHLCQECYAIHRRPIPTRNHRLLDKEHMPRSKTVSAASDAIDAASIATPLYEHVDKCHKHHKEILQYFCDEHRELVCSVCMILEHRTCKASHIPSDPQLALESVEYKAFKEKLVDLQERAMDIKSNAAETRLSQQLMTDKALDEIRILRNKINAIFDDMEGVVMEKVARIQSNDDTVLTYRTKKCDDALAELQSITDHITRKEERNQNRQIFIQLKQGTLNANHLEEKIKTLRRENEVRQYKFYPSDFVTELVRDTNIRLGNVVITAEHGTAMINDSHGTLSEFIDYTPTDENKPLIGGLVVLSDIDIIVITDRANKCVKVIDTTHYCVINQLDLELEPFGIACVGYNTIAFTQPSDSVIRFVHVDQHKMVRKAQHILVSKWCYGICYLDNKMIVSFVTSFSANDTRLNNVRIIDMKGNILRTFKTDSEGFPLFAAPVSLAVNQAKDKVYVSDILMNAVICMTLDGKQVAMYKDETLQSPEGVAIANDGNVYVSSYGNDQIHVLASDLRRKYTLVYPGEDIGICKPRALAFCDKDHKLYVGVEGRCVVKVVSGL